MVYVLSFFLIGLPVLEIWILIELGSIFGFWGPSMMPISSMPVTVMVCGVSQSLVVNVIDPGVRVASVSSVDVMERTGHRSR